MNDQLLPTTSEIQCVFKQQITECGGTFTDGYDDDKYLFLRSLLLPNADIRPGDTVQGGVALRTDGKFNIEVQPYVFREICRNGAIGTAGIDKFVIQRATSDASDQQIDTFFIELREAIIRCSNPAIFCGIVDTIKLAARTAIESNARAFLYLKLSKERRRKRVAEIMSRYESEGDDTIYGLMNAVTSTARDTRDPHERWDLEEFGGGIAALATSPRQPSDSTTASMTAV